MYTPKKKPNTPFFIFNLNFEKIKDCIGWDEVLAFIGREYMGRGGSNILSTVNKKVLIDKKYYISRSDFLPSVNMF